jgi:hypothetical protein
MRELASKYCFNDKLPRIVFDNKLPRIFSAWIKDKKHKALAEHQKDKSLLLQLKLFGKRKFNKFG